MIKGYSICDCGKKHQLDKCPVCNTPECFTDYKHFNPHDWIYDLESYPNIFTAAFKHPATNVRILFEISDRRNDIHDLYNFLKSLKVMFCRMIGFNNVGYDYTMLHFIIENYHFGIDVDSIYNKNMEIINTDWGDRWSNVIWEDERHVQQIDLFLINHFDNKSTSLKLLEFNMGMDNIKDLPYPPGTFLNDNQKDELIKYNHHDVDATFLFYIQTLEMISFREELSIKYDKNFINHNDTKIGKDYFIMRLEDTLRGSCYSYENGHKETRQTIRLRIILKDVIFDYINFTKPGFQQIKQWLENQTIDNFDLEYMNIKGVFKELIAVVDNFEYKFGSGGIHGSIDSSIIKSDDKYIIEDWDVASYYPNLAIANNLYPKHLSEQFCVIYKDVFEQRRSYAKGTPENAMLKLALNGVYGDSNNKYSPFYDPQYTMSITINGQLLLCMLAQYLIDVPDLKMIQINTDGLTIRYPRIHKEAVHNICKWWENYTQLELESAVYSRMFIRDVNNYIAEYENGDVKRKGAYEYELEWHQDFSQRVVANAAEAFLLHGQCIDDFIYSHGDVDDFMLRTKVGKKDNLMLNETIELQRTTRYYVAKQGGLLTKVSPPTKGYKIGQWKRANSLTDDFYSSVRQELLDWPNEYADFELDTTGCVWDERINTKNKSKYEQRVTKIKAGYMVSPCNDINDFNRNNLNYDYYIKEAHKLVDTLLDQR